MRLLLVLAFFAPAAARADAIEPFEGECPPGSSRAIRDHAEACVPLPCAGDSDCGDGATCVAVFECWADRPYLSPHAPEPGAPRPAVVGACDDARACTEGTCRERRQCEPTAPTPAWDPARHAWTRTPYVAPGACSAGRAAEVRTLIPLFLVLLVGRRRTWR